MVPVFSHMMLFIVKDIIIINSFYVCMRKAGDCG